MSAGTDSILINNGGSSSHYGTGRRESFAVAITGGGVSMLNGNKRIATTTMEEGGVEFGGLSLPPSPLEPILMELKRKYGAARGIIQGFGGNFSTSNISSSSTLLGGIADQNIDTCSGAEELFFSMMQRGTGPDATTADAASGRKHGDGNKEGSLLYQLGEGTSHYYSTTSTTMFDMAHFSDLLLQQISGFSTSSTTASTRRHAGGGSLSSSITTGARTSRRRRPLLSHAQNLIMASSHLRRISPDSLDMDGIVQRRGPVGPLSGLFSAPGTLLRQNLQVDRTPQGGLGAPIPFTTTTTSGAPGGARRKKKTRNATQEEMEVANLLALQRDRKVAQELAALLGGLAHEMSLDEFATVENDLFTSIFALLNSKDKSNSNTNRLAGVIALDALVDVTSADEEKKAIKFANSLSSSLRSSGDYDFLAGVSHALGRMALGSANVDYVEFEVTRSLEWLRVERSDRRLAAVLTLKELAQNAPTTFYSKTNQSLHSAGCNEFVENIMPVLRDPQPIVRACAADALSECLQFLIKRQHRSTTSYLCEIYTGMMDGLTSYGGAVGGAANKPNQPSTSLTSSGSGRNVVARKSPLPLPVVVPSAADDAPLHGSLLVLTELLRNAGTFMIPRFEETCEAVYSLIEKSKALIRLEILRLSPILAETCPISFESRFLHRALDFILESASTPPLSRSTIDLRPCAFASLGQLSLAVADGAGETTTSSFLQPDNALVLRLEDIFSLLRSGLKASTGGSGTGAGTSAGVSASSAAVAPDKVHHVTRACLHCAANVVSVVGRLVSFPSINELLDDMFSSGLSEDLIVSAQSIATNLPSQQQAIEERLFKELSLYLAGTHLSVGSSMMGGLSMFGTTASRYQENTLGDSSAIDRRRSRSTPTASIGKAHDSDDVADTNYTNIRIKISQNPEVVTKLVLSLRTLGMFARANNQSYPALLPFVLNVVSKYVKHPNDEVRKEAALCCCQLLLPPRAATVAVVVSESSSSPSSQRSKNETAQPRGCKSSSMSSQTFDGLANSIQCVHHGKMSYVASMIGTTSGRIVEEVVHMLLMAVVSDTSAMVRLCIIQSLDTRYDIFLVQLHHLKTIFLILRDENLLVRAAGLRLLGRLAIHNTALILPKLRWFFLELLSELKCGEDNLNNGKESAIRLLIVFLKCEALHRIVHSFLASIVEALPLRGVSPRIASASLEALGELSCVVRLEMCPWIGHLFPFLLESMQDFSSASLQTTSFRALGLVTGSTGYVISPYLDYPQLLPQAAAVLPGTKRAPWSLRREVIRTFGVLGAIDPRRYSSTPSKARSKRGRGGGGYFVEEVEDETDHHVVGAAAVVLKDTTSGSSPTDRGGDQHDDDDRPAHFFMYEQYAMTAQPISKLSPPERLTPQNNEDFYSTVAVQALTRILKDPTLAVHHGMAMQAIMFTFNALGLKCVPFLKGIVPYILQTCRSCSQEKLRESLLQQIAKLVIIVKDHLRPYVISIFSVVEEFWFTQHLPTILALVEKMAEAVPDHFVEYVPRLVPLLLKSLDSPRTWDWTMVPTGAYSLLEQPLSASNSDDVRQLALVLQSIRSMRRPLIDYLHLLVPGLMKLIEYLISTKYSPTSTSENNRSMRAVIVLAIETLASIITNASSSSESTSPTHGGFGFFDPSFPLDTLANNNSAADHDITTHCHVTARAVQPLIRLLGNLPCKEIGVALVDAICVCALQLGRDQWICCYHSAARDAILAWQQSISSVDFDAEDSAGWQFSLQHQHQGLAKYDRCIQQLISRRSTQDFLGRVRKDSRDPLMIATDEEKQDFVGEGGGGDAYDENVSEIDESQQSSSLSPQITQVFHQTSTFRVNLSNLQRAWDVSQRTTREDWDEWMRRFAVQLLREAPNPALRASAGLAHAFPPLARELFSAAFLCCWVELNEQYQCNLIQSMEIAFISDVSPDTLQTLLNLAEFIERDGPDGGGLPIQINVLAQLALKCRAYAKALHYKEREHKCGSGTVSCIEELISINKKLDLPEAALGVLKATQNEIEHWRIAHSWGVHPSLFGSKHYGYSPEIRQDYQHQMLSLRNIGNHHHHHGADTTMSGVGSEGGGSSSSNNIWSEVEVQESWLAKLGSWSEALVMYERRLKLHPGDTSAVLGCLHCLDARGDWNRVLKLAKRSWPTAVSSRDGDGDNIADMNGEEESSGPSLTHIEQTPTSSSPITARDHRKAMKYCAQAAWRLGQWDDLENYANELVRGGTSGSGTPTGAGGGGGSTSASSLFDLTTDAKVDFDGAFYSAVLWIHRKKWSRAEEAIDAARRAMEGRFTALMSESYKRAYPSMVTAQTLAEMEEIISYMKLTDKSITERDVHRHEVNKPSPHQRRQRLLDVWRKRLAGCRVDSEVHSSILAVRSLILGPMDDVESTITLSSLCRQAHCYRLAERVLCNPLSQLGANMEGPVFGHGFPPSWSFRASAKSTTIDTLVSVGVREGGFGVGTSTSFGSVKEQEEYACRLVQDAGGSETIHAQHQLYFAYLRHLWATGNRDEALRRLERLSVVVDLVAHHCGDQNKISDNGVLQVACWLKLGDWKMESATMPHGGDGTSVSLSTDFQSEVLLAYKKAVASKTDDYKAWHAWALTNFRLVQMAQQEMSASAVTTRDTTRESIGSSSNSRSRNLMRTKKHVVAAVDGFTRAISYGTKRWSASVQQDMLNFLTCLFKFGEYSEVRKSINEGLSTVTLESWLGVLPQLLARIHIQSPSIRSLLHDLLTRLGAKHPQALMYPLSVLLKSPVIERKQAAENLMNTLKAHSSDLVEQSLMVSSELVRVAILWLEMWHEGLEDASRLYYGEGNVQGMLDVLLPLHEQLEQGPSTRLEHDFIRSFGRDLGEAHAVLKEYQRLVRSSGRGTIPTHGGFKDHNGPASASAVEEDASTAAATTATSNRTNAEAEYALREVWDLYYTVFRRINKQLPGLVRLELANCSPALLNAHNLELGVPGSYRVDGQYVRIERFQPSVQVITSKQRPRKVTLLGNDGNEYMFLLKGHEDLRQDERVMQLFGLVNALLAKDPRTNKHDLNIQRYAITPLSHDAGLVGWVPHCETLHSLIREYRESKKILLNTENREMLKMAPDYDLLGVMQKVEVFDTALQRTIGKGNDLHEVLWIKSSDSEEWLEHRTKYTRSLAVMSMVGYILGLGDRHPSNLMLDEISGRVLHIDFGDCFEVAMHRDKYPETIPFRLTRMLINGMEVSKIEGSYKSTCERTMGVLRDNKDSLIAMLEAFVYDPLITWRLLGRNQTEGGEQQQQTKTNDGGAGGNAETPIRSGAVGIHVRPETTSAVGRGGGGRAGSLSYAMNQHPVAQQHNNSRASVENDGAATTSNTTRKFPQARGSSTLQATGEEEQQPEEVQEPQVQPQISDQQQHGQGPAVAPMHQGMSSQQHHQQNTKGLQMYSQIQSMAASLRSTSSRIAGITVNDASRAAAEGSLAQSRIEMSVRQRAVLSMLAGERANVNEEALNERALNVIKRVQDKLAGTDFLNHNHHETSETTGGTGEDALDVQEQVRRLIVQATSSESLCQLFIGWCAFW